MKKEQEQYWRKTIYTINLFKRYFAGELDSRERKIIENWAPDKDLDSLGANPINPKIVEKYGMQVKKKVFDQLGLHNPEEKTPIKKKLFTTPYLLKYASVAAIISIGISVSYFMIHPDSSLKDSFTSVKNEKQLFAQTNPSQTKEVQLPDGTKIHINSSSSLSYIEKEYGKEKREVWLEGEAYFDVTKNPDKPFIIHSKEITTSVRGTSFNIQAYENIGEITITVATGKVEVSSPESTIGVLTPNKQLVYKEENKTHVIADRNWEDAAAWMEKRLVLRDANVNELKLRLQQIYGMDIMIEDGVLSGSILNASYPKNTNIKSVLQGIKEMYDIEYSIDEKNKTVRIYE